MLHTTKPTWKTRFNNVVYKPGVLDTKLKEPDDIVNNINQRRDK